MSEAQAIATYIYETYPNIPKAQILLEDQSTTTLENLKFSKTLAETFMDKPLFLFVTNDYHVFRTSVFAKQLGMKGDGLGCSTARYYIPSAFIREFVALCVRLKWVFAGLYLLFIILIFMAYRGIFW